MDMNESTVCHFIFKNIQVQLKGKTLLYKILYLKEEGVVLLLLQGEAGRERPANNGRIHQIVSRILFYSEYTNFFNENEFCFYIKLEKIQFDPITFTLSENSNFGRERLLEV